jgi:hypothetical protein
LPPSKAHQYYSRLACVPLAKPNTTLLKPLGQTHHHLMEYTHEKQENKVITKTKIVTTQSNKVSNMSKPLRHITNYVKEDVR